LVSDQSGEICDAFGVWVEKNLYGRKYMGIERSTFLIDKLGVIQDVWRKVRVKDHVEKVLDAAKALS
jgi:peroxiredoxin Q/BCP